MTQHRRTHAVVFTVALATSAAACAGGAMPWNHAAAAPRACYWLSNEGAGWVKFPDVETKAQCYDLNSCGPGGGASGGGCYKWAPGKDAPGDAW